LLGFPLEGCTRIPAGACPEQGRMGGDDSGRGGDDEERGGFYRTTLMLAMAPLLWGMAFGLHTDTCAAWVLG